MNKIKHTGTISLALFCLLGMLTVFCVAGSTVIAKLTKKNDDSTSNLFLQNVSVDMGFLSDLARKYADYDNQIESYKYYVDNVENVIENFCTTSFPGNNRITQIANTYAKEILNIDSEAIQKYDGEYPPEVIEAEKNVVDLNEYCLEREIPFVYVQAPSKLRYDWIYGEERQTKNNLMIEDIEKADMLISCLIEDGVSVFDLSSKEELISNLSFFESHWSCENALYATELLEDYLSKLGIIEDTGNTEEKMYLNILSTYAMDELGYKYTLPVPMKSDIYTVDINEKNSLQGTFSKVFLVDESAWGNSENLNKVYHNLWRLKNGELMQIENKSREAKKIKLLLLGDSFSWPVSAYLSQEIGHVDTFHPQYFPGSVRKYIELTQPDIVLLMYIDGQMNKSTVYNAYGALAE